MSDSVSIDSLRGRDGKKGGRGRQPPLAALSVKALVALFLIYAFVVSDVFTNSVVAGFRGGVQGRHPTAFGTVLQGVFLVIFYVLALNLVEGGVI